jgi:hypothetical protein
VTEEKIKEMEDAYCADLKEQAEKKR